MNDAFTIYQEFRKYIEGLVFSWSNMYPRCKIQIQTFCMWCKILAVLYHSYIHNIFNLVYRVLIELVRLMIKKTYYKTYKWNYLCLFRRSTFRKTIYGAWFSICGAVIVVQFTRCSLEYNKNYKKTIFPRR